jgi:hypothetical protein
VSDAWRCPKCGEIIEPQFELCWKCTPAGFIEPRHDFRNSLRDPVCIVKIAASFGACALLLTIANVIVRPDSEISRGILSVSVVLVISMLVFTCWAVVAIIKKLS